MPLRSRGAASPILRLAPSNPTHQIYVFSTLTPTMLALALVAVATAVFTAVVLALLWAGQRDDDDTPNTP